MNPKIAGTRFGSIAVGGTEVNHDVVIRLSGEVVKRKKQLSKAVYGTSQHNRRAWDRQVEIGNRWTVPVSPETIATARRGEWSVLLTPTKPVPREWFPSMEGLRVLCLASGGGQQGPVLAAAGASVWVLDNSPKQLDRDRSVAERDGLALDTVLGDMADLGAFDGGAFDLVFHPVSNCFVPDVGLLWREAFRVLGPGGILMAGFANPALYLFDDPDLSPGADLVVRHRLPHSDLESLSEERKEFFRREGIPLEFGHTLEAQIGGQIEAGFAIDGFYEDGLPPGGHPLSGFMDPFIATRAVKPEITGP